MNRVACLGEVMLELSPLEQVAAGAYSMGVAGDTFNTAVMLSRNGVDTAYCTRLGSDQFSADIIARAESEGLSVAGIQTCGSTLPGLYAIQNSADGERQFHYWRDNSPARELFSDRGRCRRLIQDIKSYQWLYFSGITVAVMALSAPQAFLDVLAELKQADIRLAFDPNYRPALWPDEAVARDWYGNVLPLVDVVLPTYEDEQLLWQASEPEAVIDHCLAAGVDHVVVKCPDAMAIGRDGPERFALRSSYQGEVVDTTGAGDAFNAGYLAAFFAGAPMAERLRRAHETAAKVIAVKGALP